MNIDELLYFVYMSEQENTVVQNEMLISKGNDPHQTDEDE